MNPLIHNYLHPIPHIPHPTRWTNPIPSICPFRAPRCCLHLRYSEVQDICAGSSYASFCRASTWGRGSSSSIFLSFVQDKKSPLLNHPTADERKGKIFDCEREKLVFRQNTDTSSPALPPARWAPAGLFSSSAYTTYIYTWSSGPTMSPCRSKFTFMIMWSDSSNHFLLLNFIIKQTKQLYSRRTW